ncbi:hypothetical protein BGY98DRAFT_95053 [Russula aff. rugulosa BPL654]|nr:hypothetical protein BGY98DRAFT_95053 [Russula aff. rugulosa BPL654]
MIHHMLKGGYISNTLPPVLTAEAGSVLGILWPYLTGIYFWEFFTTLDYEWRVIRGRLPHRYTIWIYTLTRVACLMGVILANVGDVSTPINCQLWVSSIAIFSLLSFASASLLVVLRIIAIWNHHKVVVVASIVIWGSGIAFNINAAVRVRSTWSPLVHNCLSVTTEKSVLGQIPTIFANLVLILIMLVGLLLLRRQGGGMFGLTPILWRQAVIWLSIAMVTGTPPAVIAVLSDGNLFLRSIFDNCPLNSIPLRMLDQLADIMLTPSLITMTIAATRMHRYLVDYASGFPDVVTAQDNNKLPMSSVVFSNIKRARAGLNSSDRIKVTVHTASEQQTTNTDERL